MVAEMVLQEWVFLKGEVEGGACLSPPAGAPRGQCAWSTPAVSAPASQPTSALLQLPPPKGKSVVTLFSLSQHENMQELLSLYIHVIFVVQRTQSRPLKLKHKHTEICLTNQNQRHPLSIRLCVARLRQAVFVLYLQLRGLEALHILPNCANTQS